MAMPSMDMMHHHTSFHPHDVESFQNLNLGDADRSGGEMETTMILSAVAEALEQLRSAGPDIEEKERIVVQLSHLAETNPHARAAIGYHAQAIPLLVGLLRAGSLTGRTHAASTLAAICDEEELRAKVLLGGCMPPMLLLLRNSPPDSQLVAAEALFAMSRIGSARENVGTRIFSSEGVVPCLLEQLHKHESVHPDVLSLLTGTMRNLCNSLPGFWRIVESAGGIDIFTSLLASSRPATQENAAALITSFLRQPSPLSGLAGAHFENKSAVDAAAVVVKAGAILPLLTLLEPTIEMPVRTQAVGAICALTEVHGGAREKIVSVGGVGLLIRATVAPSVEILQVGNAQVLQERAMSALANIAGGKPQVIASLAHDIQQTMEEEYLVDNMGALAYALMVLEEDAEAEGEGGQDPDKVMRVDAGAIERALIGKLSSHPSPMIQERSVEALASLYSNPVASRDLLNAEAKRMLVGLITLSSSPEASREMVEVLQGVAIKGMPLWSALHEREGVLQLVGLLGLSTEDQQEYACTLLYILTNEVDDSKWAITAAGGIPPLVSLLSTGTPKAKEDAAALLGNLCSYNEDIRACVETAEAAPALLNLLGGGSPRGQAVAAKTLVRLVSAGNAGAATVGQLTHILVAEVPESKVHVLRVLGHLLAEAPEAVEDGSAANEALQALVALLEAERVETKESAAAVLANLFAAREDLRESREAVEAIPPLVRLVEYATEPVAMQAARALAAIFCSIDTNLEAAQVARSSIFPLVKLAKARETSVAEVATTALANLLANEELAQVAPAEEVILPLSRLLREGTEQGKEHAAGALAHLLHSRPLDEELSESLRQCSTVLALVALLAVSSSEEASLAALEALAAMARSKAGVGMNALGPPPLQVLSEVPYSIAPLVTLLATGIPIMQDKVIEVLSRLCKDQPVTLGDMIANADGCISALAVRVTNSESLEVKVGGTALLICAAKEHRDHTMTAMVSTGTVGPLIKCLVEMLACHLPEDSDPDREASAAVLVNSVALWLLSVLASHDEVSKMTIAQAGAVEVLIEKLAVFSPNGGLGMGVDDLAGSGSGDENGGMWVCALLLSILFCSRDVVRMPISLRAIMPLANLLKSEDPSERYFAAQAVCSLVTNGSRGTLLAVANAGAVPTLLSFLGRAETDMTHLHALAEDFTLAVIPEQAALEKLFRCDDIRNGQHGTSVIPHIVELLTPMAERPSAPPVAITLLTQLAASSVNRRTMADYGAVEAVTRYLTIGPKEGVEEAATELLQTLFASEDELRVSESSHAALEQLVTVLRIGARGSRMVSATALEALFQVDMHRMSETALHAIPPLTDLLASGSVAEQRAAAGALCQLGQGNVPRLLGMQEDTHPMAIMPVALRLLQNPETHADVLAGVMELLHILFAHTRGRNSPVSTALIKPLIALLSHPDPALEYRAVTALDLLMEDDPHAEVVASSNVIGPMVNLIEGERHGLHAAAASALFKVAKDRRQSKLDMANAGIIERIVTVFPSSPVAVAALFAELLRVLTNNTSIARSNATVGVVSPLLYLLSQPELSASTQTSALQTLVNILDKPGRLETLDIDPEAALSPLLPLLNSPSLVVQQLSAGLLGRLMAVERFQQHPYTASVAPSLGKLLGSDLESLRAEGLKALELASKGCAPAISEAGGIEELSRLVATAPPPMWQSAATVLANVLQGTENTAHKVPIPVLVRLLATKNEEVQSVALTALLAVERADPRRAEEMARLGLVEALIGLMSSHVAEEAAARLLEAIFNNPKVRDSAPALRSIAPLASYLMDPHSRDANAKLLAALALGDLFQEASVALKTVDLTGACKALVALMGEKVTEDLVMVALCGLQNLVANSRTNKKAVAEAGGMTVLMDILAVATGPDVISQAANLVRLMLNNHTVQEYATPELLTSLTIVVEKELWKSASVNEELLQAIEGLLGTFSRLRFNECSTSCIPVLIGAMKVGSEVAQETALNILWLLRQGWSQSKELARVQSVAMGDAIPVLQLMLRSGPVNLYEKAETLLSVLPGQLSVCLKRGINLKTTMGGTSAYCKIMLGEEAPKLTKVIQGTSEPDWKQTFSWPLDAPPTGQMLQVACKNKGALGTSSLGKAVIQIDRVVALGMVSGTYVLEPETNRDGSQRTIEVDFMWSNA